MNPKKNIMICLVLFQVMSLFSQRVEFTYDDNGNRLSRTLIVEVLRSDTVEFPIVNNNNLQLNSNSKAKSLDVVNPSSKSNEKTIDEITRERLKLEEGEITTNVYPNPNKGLIKIEISNMPLNSNSEMRLYDLNGNELRVKRNFESYSEMDISQLRDGIYILRIKINGKRFHWKVIKN